MAWTRRVCLTIQNVHGGLVLGVIRGSLFLSRSLGDQASTLGSLLWKRRRTNYSRAGQRLQRLLRPCAFYATERMTLTYHIDGHFVSLRVVAVVPEHSRL